MVKMIWNLGLVEAVNKYMVKRPKRYAEREREREREREIVRLSESCIRNLVHLQDCSIHSLSLLIIPKECLRSSHQMAFQKFLMKPGYSGNHTNISKVKVGVILNTVIWSFNIPHLQQRANRRFLNTVLYEWEIKISL